jgi:Tfp pilus assembly protein PilE
MTPLGVTLMAVVLIVAVLLFLCAASWVTRQGWWW